MRFLRDNTGRRGKNCYKYTVEKRRGMQQQPCHQVGVSQGAYIFFYLFFKNRGVKKRGVQRRRKEKKNVQVVRGEESLYIFLEEGSLDPHLDE